MEEKILEAKMELKKVVNDITGDDLDRVIHVVEGEIGADSSGTISEAILLLQCHFDAARTEKRDGETP